MPKYRYEINGVAADDQTWHTTGVIETINDGEFAAAPRLAMRESFMQLTQGKATYGTPGIGCHGPYRVTRLLIEGIADA